jgi:NADH pyrophosphatase NudC (nudix superfamily)
MAAIHGLVFVAIGGFISTISWIVGYTDLIVFFYTGLFFAAYGLVRFFIDSKKNHHKNQQHHRQTHIIQHQNAYYHHQGQTHQVHHQLHPVHQQRQAQQIQHYKRCNYCKNALRIHDRFCSHCGQRAQ